MDEYTKGIDTLKKLIGAEQADRVVSRFTELSPAFENEAVSVVFGRTWSRDGIDPKTRSLCSIGILAALGRQGALRIVFGIALSSGASIEEITEVLLQVAIYAGYPAAFDALPILHEVLNNKANSQVGDISDIAHKNKQDSE